MWFGSESRFLSGQPYRFVVGRLRHSGNVAGVVIGVRYPFGAEKLASAAVAWTMFLPSAIWAVGMQQNWLYSAEASERQGVTLVAPACDTKTIACFASHCA